MMLSQGLPMTSPQPPTRYRKFQLVPGCHEGGAPAWTCVPIVQTVYRPRGTIDMASVDAAKLASRSDAAMTTPLATLFFPSPSPTASLLASLAVFAIVLAAWPIRQHSARPCRRPLWPEAGPGDRGAAHGASHLRDGFVADPCRDRRHSADAAGG